MPILQWSRSAANRKLAYYVHGERWLRNTSAAMAAIIAITGSSFAQARLLGRQEQCEWQARRTFGELEYDFKAQIDFREKQPFQVIIKVITTQH